MTNQANARRVPSSFRARGFTLIELLLVVAISLIAAGIAVPLFSKSFQGSQLRAAARAVVMSVKYTRSMTVLKQHYMAILFDRVSGSIEIVSMADRASLAGTSRFLADRSEANVGNEASTAAAITSELRKPLPADVKISAFEASSKGQALNDIYWVNFFPNGMSEGFVIELQDKAGKRARIEVEGISGDTSVEFL
ncbi:MAG: prepilin-type N-terminal cleavage/methylation domain-containing protein [Kiritimatiellae bacterium]|nr:prepilin-type N-terminal cleavage/methylation domain-containing protein [Kiritimatiellia bacterium]